MIIYNKLVRDNIPDIITKQGATPLFKILTENQYLVALDEKLNEELLEYQENKELEELADMLEIIYAIAHALGVSMEELEKLRLNKVQSRADSRKHIF